MPNLKASMLKHVLIDKFRKIVWTTDWTWHMQHAHLQILWPNPKPIAECYSQFNLIAKGAGTLTSSNLLFKLQPAIL